MTQKLKFGFGRVENIVGKGENAGYPGLPLQIFISAPANLPTVQNRGHLEPTEGATNI